MTVKLVCGLGNQMFIYAFAKALELEGCEVIIDASIFAGGGDCLDSNPYPAKLELKHFNISMPLRTDFCLDEFARRFDKWRFYRYKAKNLIRHLRGRPPKAYRYCHFIYESPKMLEDKKLIKICANLHKDTYFEGFFQHLHCFCHIESIIRKEFTLKSPLSPANQRLKERILATADSVFLHIRRGDYLQIPHFIKLASGYYNGALRAILARVSNPYIFVFSDDIDFAKSHLLKCLDSSLTSKARWKFMSGNENNPVQEMELMRSCKHAIIANSTFSWWAAYLMANPHKVVAMPSSFFYDDTIPKAQYLKQNGYIEIDYNWGFEV